MQQISFSPQRSQVSQGTQQFKGGINVITGPMFSGKSQELIRLMQNYKRADKTVKMYIYGKEQRVLQTMKEDGYTTQNVIQITSLDQIDKNDLSDIVLIDNAHFFDDIVTVSEELANNYNKFVIVSGLLTDYKRQPFINMCTMVAIADQVTRLSAICYYCGAQANYTIKRQVSESELKNKQYIQSDSIQDNNNYVQYNDRYFPGGAQFYRSVCRQCYFNQLRLEGCASKINFQ